MNEGQRGKWLLIRLNFIGIAIALVGVAWQLYRFAVSDSSTASVPAITAEPGVLLQAPDERHEIVWNPAKDPEIRIGLEGGLVEGRWRVPTFHLLATNNVAIQDATVEWRSDIADIIELLTSSQRLKENKVQLLDDNRDKILIPGPNGRPGWTYDLASTNSMHIPFVTPNQPGAEAFIPLDVFTNAMLYIVAKLPDGLGTELTPISFTVTVSWTYPTPGRQQFSVIGTAKNVRPDDMGGPLVDAVVQFAVKKID